MHAERNVNNNHIIQHAQQQQNLNKSNSGPTGKASNGSLQFGQLATIGSLDGGSMVNLQAQNQSPNNNQQHTIPSNFPNCEHIAQILMSSVYGNAILHEDYMLTLRLLEKLIDKQLLTTDDPRKLLRSSTCALEHSSKRSLRVCWKLNYS